MSDREAQLERALARIAALAASHAATRDPFGILLDIQRLAWVTIDGPSAVAGPTRGDR